MVFNYIGGTAQQRQWFEDARDTMKFPWDSLPLVQVNVSWPVEPSVPGHSEYACTQSLADLNHFSLEIRRALDGDWLSKAPPYDEFGDTHAVDVRRFYMETVAHELSHVLAFHFLGAVAPPVPLATACSWFERRVDGDGPVSGTAADLHPAGAKWADMLQEGMAETLKDALLPEFVREFDNRTNWKVKKDNYEDFLSIFINQSERAGTERVLRYWDGTGISGDFYSPDVLGLTVLNVGGADLKREYGWPRFRWVGEDAMGPNSGVKDYPAFWKVGAEPLGNPRLFPAHPQTIGDFGNFYADTGSWSSAGAWIIDNEAPPEGTPLEPYATMFAGIVIAIDTRGEWSGIFQLSQFTPDPVSPIPPYPYKDPFLTAGGGDSMVFRTS